MHTATHDPPPRPPASDVVVRDEFVLGMPHLGPHALSESQMLKHLGHLRWQAFQRLAGVPTHLVADGEGRRLYATFYHGDIEFPLAAPPHTFCENDRIILVGDLAAYGRNILDGHFALYRADDARAETWGVPDDASRDRFLQAGIPLFRLSNIFIGQETGPEKLKIGQPANADFSKLRGMAEPPGGYERNRQARETGRFFDPPPGARPAPPVPLQLEHPIDPDRDVNGVGLVYFGNFPAFFDVAERAALTALPNGGLPRPFADRRGTLRRRVGWFGNARSDDRLRMHVACAILPEPVHAESRSLPYGQMWFTLRISRASDERLIAITTADRITPLETDGERDGWRSYAAGLG